jgi:hypothetical protein
MVVDTAYLYHVENESINQSPSIRDISEFIFGENMTTIHDSVRDAEAALKAAKYILVNGSAPPIPRSSLSSGRPLNSGLLIHRIPEGCDEEKTKEMIVSLTSIVPALVLPVTWVLDSTGGAQLGKTTVFFATKEHADLAFEALPGPNRPDKANRPQKRAYLQGGGYLCIRKN